MSGEEGAPKEGRLTLGPEATVKALLVLVGALAGAGGLNVLRPQVVVPAPTSSAASAESVALMKAELLAAMADARAKSAEEAGQLNKQMATLLARSEDTTRRVSSLEGDVKSLEARTASRYTREDAARDKAAQELRDQRQDARIDARAPPK